MVTGQSTESTKKNRSVVSADQVHVSKSCHDCNTGRLNIADFPVSISSSSNWRPPLVQLLISALFFPEGKCSSLCFSCVVGLRCSRTNLLARGYRCTALGITTYYCALSERPLSVRPHALPEKRYHSCSCLLKIGRVPRG